MPYPINQRAYQFNSIQSVPVSFGLWDTALKFLFPGPRNDVTDHLDRKSELQMFLLISGGHIGGQFLSTNMALPYKLALQRCVKCFGK